MTIEHETWFKGDLLCVRAWGRDDSLEDVKRYGVAVLEKARLQNCTRILCDERELEYAIGTLDTYEYARFLAQKAPRVGRVAIVCRPEQIENGEFWETVAVNRGLKVRMYTDIDEARAWLLGEVSEEEGE